MRRIFPFFLSLLLLPLPVRAGEETKYVALTFDDGPSGRFTEMLLDGLYDRGVSGTFLLCGYRMEQYPELTRRIFEEGHEIGYHGFSHDSMKGMSRRGIAEELMKCQSLLPEGCQPGFLRPPGGICTDAVRQVAQVRQLAILSWSVDPRDWATADTAAVERSVLKSIQDGDIVLLHDMTESSVRAALDIVDKLQAADFRFVTVSQLAKLRNVRLKPGQVYTGFPPEEEN